MKTSLKNFGNIHLIFTLLALLLNLLDLKLLKIPKKPSFSYILILKTRNSSKDSKIIFNSCFKAGGGGGCYRGSNPKNPAKNETLEQSIEHNRSQKTILKNDKIWKKLEIPEYSPISNFRGGVNNRCFNFFHQFQIISTPHPIHNFWKNIFKVS